MSDAEPSNPFLYPQHDRPDSLCYQTPRYEGVSDNRVPTHDGMPPRGNRDPNANFKHCRGMDLRFFDDEGKFEPGAIEHFPQAKKLPKIKPIIGPLRGLAFSEAPLLSGPPLTPTPVDVYLDGGEIPWYGPGVYNTMATPLLDPRALKNVQVRNVVPTWDGVGVKAQDWALSYARWERDLGVALGEGKLIKTLFGAILKDVADPIDKRVIRSNLSYAQVKEGVLREVNRGVNRNVPETISCTGAVKYQKGLHLVMPDKGSWTLGSTMTASFIKFRMRRTSREDLNSPTSPATFCAKCNSDRKTLSSVIRITRNGYLCR